MRKRISAIKQYSTLGSGFKIAMRDLEIRGAGNLLGAEQSGHITAVGFELYCQLLKQSVAALKGEKVKPRVEVQRAAGLSGAEREPERTVESPASRVESRTPTALDAPTLDASRLGAACLRTTTFPSAQQRIEIYRKLAQATDKPALEALQTGTARPLRPAAAAGGTAAAGGRS